MAKFEMIEVKDAAGAQVNGMMKVDGRTILTFMKPPEVTAEVIHNMVNLPIRDDDVMFCSAIKSGKCLKEFCIIQLMHWDKIHERHIWL